MSSNRPYLIRALYEWIVDNGMTPHLLVNVTEGSASVPKEFVRDGRIILNIAPGAVSDIELGNERVAFSARFGGTARAVELPVAAVVAIYARENGHGMVFPDEESTPPPDGDDAPEPGRRRPALKVVK